MSVIQPIRTSELPARLPVREVYRLQDEGLIADSDSFELIDGEIVPMAAAKANHHEMMKSRLVEALVPVKPASTALFVEPSITFSDFTLLEPDLAIWPRGILPQEVRGPDLLLVVEVADSSLAYDLREKARLYAGFGVWDYWVVDAVRETIRVHRDPADGRYGMISHRGTTDPAAALLLPGVSIRLADLPR